MFSRPGHLDTQGRLDLGHQDLHIPVVHRVVHQAHIPDQELAVKVMYND